MTNLDSILKKQRDYFANKGPFSQGYGFSSGHVWMWELDCEESWVPKNWYFWTVMLEKTLESPLDCKEIQPVHPKGNQSWVFNGRPDAEAPILWPADAKNWLNGKDPDVGQDWRQEEKGTPEDEMVGWHHQLNGHELEQAPGVGDGQGSLACCSPWDRKESDTTEWLNWTDKQSISPLQTIKQKEYASHSKFSHRHNTFNPTHLSNIFINFYQLILCTSKQVRPQNQQLEINWGQIPSHSVLDLNRSFIGHK